EWKSALPQLLGTMDLEMRGQPVRVLLRSSWLYRRLLDGESPDLIAGPLLPEEQVQLSAGDIPYFFVNWGTPRAELLYEAKPGIFDRVAALPAPFDAILDRATPTPEYLSSETRLETLIKTTAVHLARNLEIPDGSDSQATYSLARSNQILTLQTNAFEVSAHDHAPSRAVMDKLKPLATAHFSRRIDSE
ncbi:MAG: hypothetical protein AAB425_08260, partial [Bdellovibrionota bacterium]